MAGGTGGHVYPALAVARMFIEKGIEVRWLGTRKGIESRVVAAEKNIPLHYLNVEGLRGQGIKRLIMAPAKLIAAVWQALSFYRSIKPDLVIGMGGFVTGPGGLAAKLSGIPLVIHEQNAVPGFTNRVLARFAKKIFEAFPNTFPTGVWFGREKILATGNPVRSDICKLEHPEKKYQDRSGTIRLLVLGGSQGAVAINELLPQALQLIDPKIRPQVLHQVGPNNLAAAKKGYQQRSLDAEIVPFIEDMAQAYEWADFAICRSGALTVSELQQAGLPAILVPYPFAVDDHQTRNGEVLEKAGAAIIVQQSKLNAETLNQLIRQMSDRKKLKSMADGAKASAIENSTGLVVEECLRYANAKHG